MQRRPPEHTRPTAVLPLSILLNLLLFLGKFLCGTMANAPSMVADALHSAADLLSTAVVLIGIALAHRAPDQKHPYGHDRFECVTSILLSGILLYTGISIAKGGITKITSGDYQSAPTPDAITLVVAVISIAVKIFLFGYAYAVSRRIHSTALRADAVHQLSDALASLGMFLGILFTRLGYPIFDPLASLLISVFLMKTAADIFKEASLQLIDRAADPTLEEDLKRTAETFPAVKAVCELRTRLFGAGVYAELTLIVPPTLRVSEGTALQGYAEAQLLTLYPRLCGCSVSIRSATGEMPLLREQSRQ